MYKLYFRHGTMSSSKTMNMLMVAHNYEKQNKKVILIKPNIDIRFGLDVIKSRTGIEKKANYVVKPEDNIIELLTDIEKKEISCMLVDEAQFFTADQIDQLRELTRFFPVICYGLRTDYRLQLFSGSKRLMEVADNIEEIKTICQFCNHKAIINMKFIDIGGGEKKIIKDGSSDLDLGCEEKYIPVCWNCWDCL